MKPWELRQYSFKEFLIAVKGNALREAREWDRTRHIMFVMAKTVDSKKKIKKVSDILSLPLLDKPQEGDRAEMKKKLRLAERYYALKEKLASDGNTGT